MAKPNPLEDELRVVLTSRTRLSTAGYPYLHRPLWSRFRDWVPHILDDGARVLAVAEKIAGEDEAREPALRVVRQVIRTAAVTAPPDLWLLRYVLGALREVGLADRLLAGETLRADEVDLRADELVVDLRFLLSRGTLVRLADGYRISDHAAARAALELPPVDAPADLSAVWARALGGDEEADELVSEISSRPLPSSDREPGFWHPTARDIELGFRLVPLIIGMKMAGVTELTDLTRTTLTQAGLADGESLNELGARVVQRGPGPFGIIEAYRGYVDKLADIWRGGRGEVWVERSANVAASQDANAKTFKKANDTLDGFCDETGFTYEVFIEHAVGQGEATRQRWERAGDALRYVGADLEDAAIDAAQAEQSAGRLPAQMHFVRNADIGAPATLLDDLRANGIDPRGAVMIVGNGFHEVRDQTDERMTDVMRGYESAGVVLMFTEETALAVDDLLETAWNTYHAGFKYVHERSGQGLRPADARPPSPLEGPLPASWTECAERAGYVRASRWSKRGRTVYPYTPPSGHNPAISVNHFFVPRGIADTLGFE
jgi:hypothetical protein